MPIAAAWPYTPEWLLQSKSSPREISGNHVSDLLFFKLLSIHGIVRHMTFSKPVSLTRTECNTSRERSTSRYGPRT